MNQSDLRRPAPPKRPRRTILSILLALMLFSFVATVLVFLTLGSFGLVILIAAVIFLMIAIHYVVWGWWLGHVIREESIQEEDDEAE